MSSFHTIQSYYPGNPFNPRTATRMCQSTGGIVHNSGNNLKQQPKAQSIIKYSGDNQDFQAPSGNYQSSSNNWNHGK